MLRVLALSMLCLISQGAARAQSLTVHGLAPYPKVITASQIEALGLIEVKDGREVTISGQVQRLEIRYGGVPLTRLLESQGISQLDRYRLRASSIILLAKDGYQASFSWGELFNSPIGQSVIVILRENGEKLPARDGDFTLRSFADLRPGPRHVRLLSEIRIVLH